MTPHLGNWEFGAPLLTRQGVTMQVVTLAEPDEALTQLRKASRERRNIETVVIGADPFGFVELIRRLEDGATVALLIDRPAAATATDVELFGRPFEPRPPQRNSRGPPAVPSSRSTWFARRPLRSHRPAPDGLRSGVTA